MRHHTQCAITIGTALLSVWHCSSYGIAVGAALQLVRHCKQCAVAVGTALLSVWHCIFPTAPTMSAVGKEPHLSSFFIRGPLLDWFGQIMLYSHWSTQTCRSTKACAPATDEAVVCTLIEPGNAMQGLTERFRTQIF